MRAEVNRGQILNKFKKAEQLVDDAKNEIMMGAAEWVVLRSPVDTGTYITSHRIAAGNSGGFDFQSSKSPKKARNQEWQPWANKAMDQLYSDIQFLPEDWKRASIENVALHSDLVEYEHGYGVYASLRAAWPSIKEEAIAKAEAKYK